jgi:anti-anti-sigma factor
MLRYETESGRLVCRFSGKLDTVECGRFEEELRRAVSGAPGLVVFDLADVNYVASAFLRVCLVSFKAKGAGGFSIVNMHPTVKKVFKIAGFDTGMGIG